GILALLLGTLATAVESKPATPAEQYQALLKEYQAMPEDLEKAKTAEERQKVVARLSTISQRFLALAEKHPKDPVAVDALIQTIAVVNSTAFPAGGKDTPGNRAMTILLRDHVKSDKLGRVCQQVVYGFHKSHETFLQEVLGKNPHKEVQALACLSLAQYLHDRLHRLDILGAQDQ